jgi:hypothetical protein
MACVLARWHWVIRPRRARIPEVTGEPGLGSLEMSRFLSPNSGLFISRFGTLNLPASDKQIKIVSFFPGIEPKAIPTLWRLRFQTQERDVEEFPPGPILRIGLVAVVPTGAKRRIFNQFHRKIDIDFHHFHVSLEPQAALRSE